MLLADYPISNWKDATMRLDYELVFCPACVKTWQAVKGAAVVCECGGPVTRKQETPAEPESIQDMRADKCDVSS
jgi:hypothetical protein